MRNLRVAVNDKNGDNIAPILDGTPAEHFSACLHQAINLFNNRVSKEAMMLPIETSTGLRWEIYSPIEIIKNVLLHHPEINKNLATWNNSTIVNQYEEIVSLNGTTDQEEEIFIKLLVNTKISGVARITIYPISLLELTSNFMSQHKDQFFNQLTKLPQDISEKYPQLETNYVNIFKSTMTNLIEDIEQDFKQNIKKAMVGRVEQECHRIKKIINNMKQALESDSPYNNIHHELSNLESQSFYYFSDLISILYHKSLALLGKYVVQKEEYFTHMQCYI